MRKSLGIAVMVYLLGSPTAGYAQQICQSESEVPSSSPLGRFSDHGDGTVTDDETGLMWARCAAGLSGADCATGSAGTYTWQGALDFAAGSSLAGHTDWRLPNVNELPSIVEQRCVDPAINTDVFPNTPASYFWSASPTAGYSSNAWGVHFYYGDFNGNNRSNNLHVRLVRSGQ